MERKTVPELKAMCAEQGIELVGDERKADIIALLVKYGDAEAEPAATGHAVAIEKVDCTPAIIAAGPYLESRRELIERKMALYGDMTDEDIAKMDDAELKAAHADINGLITEMEDERKAIKAALTAPIAQFEAEVKAILDPAKQVKAALADARKRLQGIKYEKRRQGLQATYEDFAPILVPVVPLDALIAKHPDWMKLTYSAGKAAHELEDEVSRIARDWAQLQAQKDSLRFYSEAEREFFRTQDLGAALQWHQEQCEQAERLERMRMQMAQNAPEPAIEQEPAPEYAEPETRPQSAPEGRKRYRFSVLLDSHELQSLREWKNAVGCGEDWRFEVVSNG